MRMIFKAGDVREHAFNVTAADIASFHGVTVHPVCSTFALAREVEWATRLFVLEMKDDDEEGIGTYLEIRHVGPAFLGEMTVIRGVFERLDGTELICSFEARTGERLIATGKTGQKILKLEKFRTIFGHG